METRNNYKVTTKNSTEQNIYLYNDNSTALPVSKLSLQLSKRRRRQARLIEQSSDISHSHFNLPTRSARCDDDDVFETMDKSPPDVRSKTGFESVSKRREANARERLRVRNLNSGFAKLRRILPTVPPNRKPSKVDTLQSAIDYIHELEHLLNETGGIPDIGCSAGTTHSHSRQSVTECPFLPDRQTRLNMGPSTRSSGLRGFSSDSDVILSFPPSTPHFAFTRSRVPDPNVNHFQGNHRSKINSTKQLHSSYSTDAIRCFKSNLQTYHFSSSDAETPHLSSSDLCRDQFIQEQSSSGNFIGNDEALEAEVDSTDATYCETMTSKMPVWTFGDATEIHCYI